MNKMNKKNKNNCHYRDCEAITDNLSRIESKKRNVIARSAQVRTSKKNVMPILPAGKIQGIFELNKRIGRSLEFFRILRKNRDDFFIFGYAKVLIIAAILSFSIISESWAINCPSGTQGSDDSTATNYCGVNCCWGITTVTNNDETEKVLTITPAINTATGKPHTNVTMKDFSSTTSSDNQTNGYTSTWASTAPWARKDVTSVVIENGISNIGKYAFDGDTKITGVTGMENVTSIGNYAFQYARSLQSVDMPNVTTIEDHAFEWASSLQSVDMPNVTTIEDHAFNDARSLQNVYMPKVTSIESKGFNWALELTAITIPASASIGDYAFNYVPTLTDVNCIGTETECTELKSLMESKRATFADGAFHIITTPTPNCGGYSQGVCSTCANGYHSADSSCVANPPNCKVFSGNACSECLSGYLTKENGCVEPSSCTGEYLISGNECIKMPGCVDFADGACGGCESGYYKKETGCVSATEGCGEGYLEKDSICISATQGCGAGYKDMGGFCNRIQYTPAEAAAILNDNNNTITITFKK